MTFRLACSCRGGQQSDDPISDLRSYRGCGGKGSFHSGDERLFTQADPGGDKIWVGGLPEAGKGRNDVALTTGVSDVAGHGGLSKEGASGNSVGHGVTG